MRLTTRSSCCMHAWRHTQHCLQEPHALLSVCWYQRSVIRYNCGGEARGARFGV